MTLNKYVVAIDLVFNIVIIYVIRGAAETIPTPAEAVAMIGITNAVTTWIHALASVQRLSLKNLFVLPSINYKSHIYYCVFKLFLVSFLVVI